MIELKAHELIDPDLEAHFHFHQKLKYWTIVHYHNFYEIFIITEGTVFHIINGVRQILTKGDLVFIRPHDIHSYEKHGDDEVQLLNINFRIQTITSVFGYLGEGFRPDRLDQAELSPMVRLSPIETRRILEKYENIAAIPLEYTAEIRTAVRALLSMLLSEHFFPKTSLVRSPDAPDWLETLQTEMQKKEHFTDGLDALYRLTKLSPEHLSRTIHKHLGKTPTAWINDLRLQHAAHLLKHSNIEIIAVALECGFNNLSHFYKTFQSSFRFSPGKYRNLHRRAAIPQ